MTLTEIKKELYKRKPAALFICAGKGGLTYETSFWTGEDTNLRERVTFYFRVPFADMGDATFHHQMEAQQLIRYIVTPENSTI